MIIRVGYSASHPVDLRFVRGIKLNVSNFQAWPEVVVAVFNTTTTY